MDEHGIQNRIKKIFGALPGMTLPEEDRRKFLAWLYKAADEKKKIVRFEPFKAGFRLAGAVAGLVFFVFLFNYFFMPVSPVISSVRGPVKVYRVKRNEWAFVEKPHVKLGRSDIIKTFDNGQADVVIPGLYHIRVKENSELKLAKSPARLIKRGTGYELNKGKVFAYYVSRGKEHYDENQADISEKFTIETPQADVSAVGTDFVVNALPALNKTWIGVLDGTVKVTGRFIKDIVKQRNATVFVKPGEKTVVHAGKAPGRPARFIEDELLEMEELYHIGTKPQVALLISTGPSRTRELLSLTLLYISSEERGVLHDKIEEVEKNFRRIVKDKIQEEYLANIEEFEEIVNTYPDPKYDVQLLLFIGAYYEFANMHEKAISTFRRVINEYPEANLASIAQCAIGIVYEEKLNNSEKARNAYQDVLDLYPKSPEVKEASEGLVRLPK